VRLAWKDEVHVVERISAALKASISIVTLWRDDLNEQGAGFLNG